jgi:hypothetical protein
MVNYYGITLSASSCTCSFTIYTRISFPSQQRNLFFTTFLLHSNTSLHFQKALWSIFELTSVDLCTLLHNTGDPRSTRFRNPQFYFSIMRSINILVGFEVLTAVSMKIAVFWVVAPCSLVEVYQRFRAIFINILSAVKF